MRKQTGWLAALVLALVATVHVALADSHCFRGRGAEIPAGSAAAYASSPGATPYDGIDFPFGKSVV